MKLELEKFIDKPIEELIQFGEVDKELKNVGFSDELNNFRTLDLKFDEELGGITYNKLQIIVDDNQAINELYTAFPIIVDRFFYNEMITRYGYPNTIQVIDKLIEEKESENNAESKNDFHQTLRKRSFLTKEGKFEDKPFWILWKKESYEIKLMFYYKENATQLIFRKPKANLF